MYGKRLRDGKVRERGIKGLVRMENLVKMESLLKELAKTDRLEKKKGWRGRKVGGEEEEAFITKGKASFERCLPCQ